jgi:predicted cupin superfamily sugar epimerase
LSVQGPGEASQVAVPALEYFYELTMTRAQTWIDELQLRRHPEGGWFRETYRSAEMIPQSALPARFGGDRALSTAIYFLLERGDFSALHRIKQDEVWHFYEGSPLTLHLIDPDGDYSTIRLGRELGKQQVPQAVVSASWLVGATVDGPEAYSLVGCTVAPGFDFADFEIPDREELCRKYSRNWEAIVRLTR